jgi:hypothetical protein
MGWLYAVVRGGRPAVESVPFDVVVNFSAGSGALTATHLNNGTHGADWGTWEEWHQGGDGTPNEHSTIVDHDIALPFSLLVGGNLYDGSEGQGMSFDHSGDPSEYDSFKMFVVPTITDCQVLYLARFNTNLGSNSVNYDVFHLQGSDYTVSQYQHSFNDIQQIYTHSEGDLGGTVQGIAGTWVIVGMLHDAAGQVGELFVQDATTLEVLGSSRVNHATPPNELLVVLFQDYLRLGIGGTGSIDFKLFALRESGPWPPYALTVPAPTDVAVSQTAANTLTLTWTSPMQTFTIERNVDAAGWSVVDALYDNNGTDSRVDATLSNGQSVQYRVTAFLGEQASGAVTSNTVTVSN